MPCLDPGRTSYVENPINEKMESMLCSACRVLEKLGYDFDENPRLSEWWDDHKKKDEKRKKDEAKRAVRAQIALELSKRPVSKLSKKEIQVLIDEGYLEND